MTSLVSFIHLCVDEVGNVVLRICTCCRRQRAFMSALLTLLPFHFPQSGKRWNPPGCFSFLIISIFILCLRIGNFIITPYILGTMHSALSFAKQIPHHKPHFTMLSRKAGYIPHHKPHFAMLSRFAGFSSAISSTCADPSPLPDVSMILVWTAQAGK